MNIRYYIFILLWFYAPALRAQDASFKVSVNQNKVGTGEQFEVSFTLNTNGDRFSPPNFAGFQIVAGPNESSSMSSINGAVSQSVSISYVLMAENEGTFTIGPASILINGKQVSTNPVKITVVKGLATQRRNSSRMQGGDPNASVEQVPASDVSKDIFIRAEVDKTNVYLGQQIMVNYRLYTRLGIAQFEENKSPELNGFWSQDVKRTQQNSQPHIENYKGQRYQVVDLKKTILFPERDGDLSIDPFAMTFVVQQPIAPRDVMEQMFGGAVRNVKVKVSSPAVGIHVKPLPTSGKPASFTGAVGSFTVESFVDKKELKANESLNYKLKVSGTGNITLLKQVNINPPSDFEKYDPKITDSIPESATLVAGSRVLNYLLIPRHEGTYTLDPVEFSYFNPNSGKYVSLSTKSFSVKVDKGIDAGGNVTSLAPSDQRDIKMLAKDVRYIKTSGLDLHQEGDSFYGSILYYTLLLLGPLLFIVALAYRQWDEKANSDIVKLKSRLANKVAARHMANAQKQFEAGETKAFYEAVSRGMYGYLGDKLNIPIANLDRENISLVLKKHSLDDGIITKVTDNLDLCEMARFAPVSGISQKQVLEQTKNLINEIEGRI
jgi:hypothetical protein